MSSMFSNCTLYTWKNLKKRNTKNLKDMSFIFSWCEQFAEDISWWNVWNVSNVMGAFILHIWERRLRYGVMCSIVPDYKLPFDIYKLKFKKLKNFYNITWEKWFKLKPEYWWFDIDKSWLKSTLTNFENFNEDISSRYNLLSEKPSPRYEVNFDGLTEMRHNCVNFRYLWKTYSKQYPRNYGTKNNLFVSYLWPTTWAWRKIKYIWELTKYKFVDYSQVNKHPEYEKRFYNSAEFMRDKYERVIKPAWQRNRYNIYRGLETQTLFCSNKKYKIIGPL